MPRRIAFIEPSALGDVVHSLPVLTALRVRFPAARITWVINTAYEPLVRGHPDLTDTLPFDRGAFKRGVWKAARYEVSFAAEQRRRRSALVVEMQGMLPTGLMCLATGAPVRVGFANAREGSRYTYTHKVRVPDASRIHAVDRYWRVAEFLGAGDIAKRFHVPLDPNEVEAVRSELAELPRPWVAVAVGAKWVTKRWPTSHFAELLRRAQSHFGGTALFVGTGDDTALSLKVIAALDPRKGFHPPPAALSCGDLPLKGGGQQTMTSPLEGEVGTRSVPGGGSAFARDFTGRTSLPHLAALLSLCDVM